MLYVQPFEFPSLNPHNYPRNEGLKFFGDTPTKPVLIYKGKREPSLTFISTELNKIDWWICTCYPWFV